MCCRNTLELIKMPIYFFNFLPKAEYLSNWFEAGFCFSYTSHRTPELLQFPACFQEAFFLKQQLLSHLASSSSAISSQSPSYASPDYRSLFQLQISSSWIFLSRLPKLPQSITGNIVQLHIATYSTLRYLAYSPCSGESCVQKWILTKAKYPRLPTGK